MSDKVNVKVNGAVLRVPKGSRLSDVLNIEKPCGGHGSCGKCKVKVNGKEELACGYTVKSDIEVETRKNSDIASQTGAEESGTVTDNLCFALDIGTTTLALALVSLDEKRTVRVITATNPQRRFGADVITRIEYCQKNTVSELQRILVREINSMIAKMNVASVDTMYVSANVTMLHTLFGVDCSSIGVAPYTPSFLESREEDAETLGIRGVKSIVSLPSLSAFVGADIVAGLHLVGMPDKGKYNILLDLGTNAEVVLYSSVTGVATAAAAGPCFEGANISCGMSATEGAVCSFELNYGHASYKTVADGKAVGICGTGLIDLISELLKNEIIDETGYMDCDYTVADGVYLSPEDIRQYQLAKSAICSAILALMKHENIGFDEISKLYISGGFSSSVNINSAVHSGLFPRELAHKTESLNNSSLLGTVKYATEGGDLDRFIENIKYIDLSSDSYFTGLFVENMMFE